MNAARFRPLVDITGPFASVYLDDSADTEDRGARRELAWRGLREQLAAAGASDGLLSVIDGAVLSARPPVGSSGRALIATPDRVVIDEHLIRTPVVDEARFSALPYLVPIIEHGTERITHVVAAVDHTGGDITVFSAGGDVVSETVDGGGYPVHTSSGAQSAGYGDPQQRTAEQARKNIRAVADRLGALVDRSSADVVFVIGEVSSRSDLAAAVAQRVRDRLVDLHVGARHSGVDDARVRGEIDEHLERRRNRRLAEVAERFAQETARASGLAVEGLTSVCAALRNGEVETLILGDVADATVVDAGSTSTLAAGPDELSVLGAAVERTLRADEALPLAAPGVDAAIIRTDERLTPTDGVGAILRFVPRTSAAHTP